MDLSIRCVPTLALGAESNTSFCIVKDDKFHIYEYEKDKQDQDSIIKIITIRLKEHDLIPKIIVRDLHPAYNTYTIANDLAQKYDSKLIGIQHHRSHMATVAAEHNLKDYIGIAMDGLGFGDDGTLWGGEVFLVKNSINFKRIGHLEEQPQLGGDSSTIYPKKMLFGILSKILTTDELLGMRLFNDKESRLYLNMIKEDFNVEKTTSAGRVLDSVSALLGVCDKMTYGGEPAILLEKFTQDAKPFELKPKIIGSDETKILSTSDLFRFVIDNIDKDKGRLAATSQVYLAEGLFEIAKAHPRHKGLPILFSGGVAFNKIIAHSLKDNGVKTNIMLLPGDSSVCIGQAYLANILLEKDKLKKNNI